MDDNQFKDAWQRHGNQLQQDNPLNISSQIINGKRRTALMRLADRYKLFIIIAFGSIFTSILWMRSSILDGSIRLPLIISFIVYFLTCGIMDCVLYHKVTSIDVNSMPTQKVIMRAMRCRKLHLQFMIILIPVAIALIGVLVWLFNSQTPFLVGILVGAVTGLIIGMVQFRRFMNDYRAVTDD